MYELIAKAMHNFTNNRNYTTPDEVWLVEHPPVFTQGKIGKIEYIPGNIPIIQSDRGGKITYHGPGQQLMYVLLNLKRRKINVRELIQILEQTVINTLIEFGIDAYSRSDAPGVYIKEMKVCSIGLRISKGCSFYGLALNMNMDLSPFEKINPCGYVGMKMTQISQWVEVIAPDIIRSKLIVKFLRLLNNPPYKYVSI